MTICRCRAGRAPNTVPPLAVDLERVRISAAKARVRLRGREEKRCQDPFREEKVSGPFSEKGS